MIRDFRSADLSALQAMYQAQGIDYRFPDLTDPIFATKLVLEDGGTVRMALAARVTTEMFYLRDPKAADAKTQWEWFQELHRAMEIALWRRGADDAHCWIPPQLKTFGKRLEQLGWVKETWPGYSKILVGG